MESELNCGKCNQFLNNPVSLPCAHNVCYECGKMCLFKVGHQDIVSNNDKKEQRLQQHKSDQQRTNQPSGLNMNKRNLTDRSDCSSVDSGYLSMYEIHSCLHQQLQGPMLSIKCPKCCVSFIVDDRGINCLPFNSIVESLVELYKYQSTEMDCQLCEESPALKATAMCEQCRVSYCDSCINVYHPRRGPLALHSLVKPRSENCAIRKRVGVLKCTEHIEENISMYCMLCKMPVCYLCFEEGRHGGHEAKALGTMFKEQKADMGKKKEELQEKNNTLNEFISQLQTDCNKVQENGVDFESRVVAQIDELKMALEAKKVELLSYIAKTVARKVGRLSEQSSVCVDTMKCTIGLIEYTKEVMKEEDPASFLMISNALCSRLSHSLDTWIGKQGLTPVETTEMELGLKTKTVMDALSYCHFHKHVIPVREEKPPTPVIYTEKCSVINNTLNLHWTHDMKKLHESKTDVYAIEVDDGMGGEYQVVHETCEYYCTLGGLQFSSTYRARIKAFNDAGESDPSDVIYLSTPQLATFLFDVDLSHEDILLSNDYQTITTTSFENRVALGNVSFSRGQHYWEVTIDRYEGNPDPAIGIAQEDCSKDAILGKDSKAWSIYVDSNRSWFQHNNAHLYRSEGGVESGSVIGLFLDLDKCQISFYCNDEKHGPIEFPSLKDVDVVYPAFSLNRNVTMTLHTGLTPPDF